MPMVTNIIDNVVPLISYLPNGDWQEGSIVSDPEGYENFDHTFTICSTNGASATFSFNGTSVMIVGAKRGNHGPYNVTIDGLVYQGDGYANPDVFQTPLYIALSLEQGLHNVVITNGAVNSNYSFLGLDYIQWDSMIGLLTDTITNETIQDTDISFNYQPPSAWNTNPGNLSSFNGLTGHSTSASGAYVNYTFEGDAVALFGVVGPESAPYMVQLDGGQPLTFNGTKEAFTAQISLFQADNLGPGVHVLTVVNQPSLSGQALSIDFATVLSLTSTNNPHSRASSSPIRSSGLAVVAIVTAVLVLTATGAIIVLLLRRRNARTKKQKVWLDRPNFCKRRPSLTIEPLPPPSGPSYITTPSLPMHSVNESSVLSHVRIDSIHQEAQPQLQNLQALNIASGIRTSSFRSRTETSFEPVLPEVPPPTYDQATNW